MGITVVYVTHDQSEALTMSDRIAVFNDGIDAAAGDRPNDLYEQPVNSFVANFIGENNRLAGKVSRRERQQLPGRGRRRRHGSRPCPVKIDGRRCGRRRFRCGRSGCASILRTAHAPTSSTPRSKNSIISATIPASAPPSAATRISSSRCRIRTVPEADPGQDLAWAGRRRIVGRSTRPTDLPDQVSCRDGGQLVGINATAGHGRHDREREENMLR